MIFGRKRKQKSVVTSRPKTLKEILTESFKTELDKDPELKKRMAFKEYGHEDLINEDPIAKAKKEFETWRWQEAIKRAKDDPEYNQMLTESVIDEISPSKSSHRPRRGSEPEYYGNEGPASLSDTLEEALETKNKMIELGIINEGGSGPGLLGGLLRGASLSDIVEGIKQVNILTGRTSPPQGTVQSVRTFVVRLDGHDEEIPEYQYKKLLQEGKLQPVAAVLEQPKTERTVTPEEIKSPELPDFLKDTDFTVVQGWMEQEPEEFVINLKGEVDANIQESRLIWGLLTTATYEGIIEKITPYREHAIVGSLVQRIMSEEGTWLKRVLELVKES